VYQRLIVTVQFQRLRSFCVECVAGGYLRSEQGRARDKSIDTLTEKVHGRARAPSRQTRRVAANEVRSRVATKRGWPLFHFLKREFLRGT